MPWRDEIRLSDTQRNHILTRSGNIKELSDPAWLYIPDYLINFFEIDRCSYLEILGMNDRYDYSVKTATKINSFSKDQYRPGREVIYVLLYDKANFDEDYFVSQVLTAFDTMIPDNAIVWKTDSEAS